MKTIDLNDFYKNFSQNPEATKFALVRRAERIIFEAVQAGRVDCSELLEPLNYAEILEDWLGWPNFQDGGIFEQCADAAVNTVLQVYGFKPAH